MVAQKNGLIRFYDLLSQQPIMSLSTGQVPLMSADWCSTNDLLVGAVARDDWIIWDMSKSRFDTLTYKVSCWLVNRKVSVYYLHYCSGL